MPSNTDAKSAEELAEATGADPTTVAKEYTAAAKLAGIDDDSDD